MYESPFAVRLHSQGHSRHFERAPATSGLPLNSHKAQLEWSETGTGDLEWSEPAPVIRESVTQAETSDTVPRIDSLNSLIDSLNSLHKSGNDT
jgi:hypothetical protein